MVNCIGSTFGVRQSCVFGTLVILVATLVFFSPYIARIDSYSVGGDAMFNAWVLSRNHHCILRENCPRYTDGNIFYPNKDTMLYSETELSAGLLTLPLHFINPNPIFAYNVWTISSFFFCGWFMYILAKLLSQNHELIAVVAGLVFEFAPLRMASLYHLQNISIFYLPLIIFFMLKYLGTVKKTYLAAMFVAMILFFYASWYQMAFGLIALIILIGCLYVFRLYERKLLSLVLLALIVAVYTTLPLAFEYIRFSRVNQANLSSETALTAFSSSLIDYFMPQVGTIAGTIFRHAHAHINAFNPDSNSYHGLTLYLVAGFMGVTTCAQWLQKKQPNPLIKFIIAFIVIGITGFILSLGPYLKITNTISYTLFNKFTFTVPLPYLVVYRLLPQLAFIRAIGRASVLVLFALCCLLALLPSFVKVLKLGMSQQYAIYILVTIGIVIELMPMHQVPMLKNEFANHLSIPPVYQFIKADPEIDNLIILHTDSDYPGAPWPVSEPEETMWSGYTNKHMFNGFSGYFPPSYTNELAAFTAFQPSVVSKMRQYGLRYVLVDKQLSRSQPEYASTISKILPHTIYEDNRFKLMTIE